VTVVICKICKNKFYTKPSQIKIGFGKYCSRNCCNKSQRKGQYINCGTCSKKSWKMPSELKHSKSKNFFCSKSCQTLWRNKIYSGENHPFWNGGTTTYRKVMERNKIPSVCVRCNEKDQRILHVHHRDQNRKNNDLKNLV